GLVEAERPRRSQLVRLKVALVKGLQRVTYQDLRTGRSPIGRVRGRVDRVEQLVQRHRRREVGAGAFVGAGVQQDEMLGGREHGIEQQLAVLAARITFADARVAGQYVVTVGH